MNKFAIYKAATGFYYYRYFDSLNQLKGTDLEGIVTEDKLPVVLDNKGGYFHFTGKDYGFCRIVETESDCPLPLEKMFFKNHEDFKLGWISPEGDTYSCDYTGHSKAAAAIAKKFFPKTNTPGRTLEKAGWIKVIDSWDGVQREHKQFVYSLNGKLTQRQIDCLFDLGLYYNPEVQEIVRDNEKDFH